MHPEWPHVIRSNFPPQRTYTRAVRWVTVQLYYGCCRFKGGENRAKCETGSKYVVILQDWMDLLGKVLVKLHHLDT